METKNDKTMNRRDFFKFGSGQKSSDAMGLDDVVIDIVEEGADHRTLRDARYSGTNVGSNFGIMLNDSGSSGNGWELVKTSDNLSGLNISDSGNLLYSPEQIPIELAEQMIELTYRARDAPYDAPAGVIGKITDQIDRYETKFTITYMADGNQETVEFNAPNNVVKEVFGWDELPPEAQTVGISAATEPQAFEQAMTNLYEILTSPEYALERSMTRNRNTPSPCPDPNPWEETETLLAALGIDPLIQDELYPQGLVLEMTDYTDGKGKPMR